jgi:hypothetical protein
MTRLSKFSFGPSLRLSLLLLVLTSIASCGVSPLGIVKKLTGGGTNVAANTQLGKTNTQTIGTTNNTEQKLKFNHADRVFQTSDNNKIKTETVENVTVNETNPWLILLLVLGWLLPSPNEIGRSIRSLFSRKK